MLRETKKPSSRKYPALIGKSAFIGEVSDDGEFDSKGCKIWISEHSMVASSFTPGSIVSVSLPSLDSEFSDIFLSSLADECARHFGIDPGDQLADKPGNYFALARIFSSFQVARNQVKLSANLSNIMGRPTSGRVVFVYSTQNEYELLAGLVSKCEKPDGSRANHLVVHDCNELVLERVHSRNTLARSRISMNISSDKSYKHPENEVLASHKTPLNQSKSSFSSVCQLISSSCEDSRVNSTYSNGLSPGPFDVMEVLGDEVSRRLLQTCAAAWLHSCCLLNGNIVTIPVLSQIYSFKVIGAKTLSVNACGVDRVYEAFFVKRETKVCPHLPWKRQDSSCVDTGYRNAKANTEDKISNLGGLSKEYEILKEIIVSSSSNTLSKSGCRPIKGVLLHGPPGTGKTSLAPLCVRDAGVKLFSVNYGESELSLREVSDSACQAAPAVVFIDDLDAIAPVKKEGIDELSLKMVTTLLILMDGINRTEGVLVIAATSRPDKIEPALRRPGRLDRETETGVPSPKQPLDILLSILSEMDHALSEMQVQHLARVTHGFAGADLAALCNMAVLACLRNHAKSRNSYDIQNGVEGDCMLKVTFEDFQEAMMRVKPSAMREVKLDIPKVKWEDVGGQREVKNQLKEVVEWPQKHQDALTRIGIRPPAGVLLFGSPGCSKTLIARAVASEAGYNFLAVKGTEVFNKWVGESEKAVKSLFAKARAVAPSIIFFDEFDGLASIRGNESDGVSVYDRVISQLLVELDGLHQRVDTVVIAATNRPDKIDPALLRQGRFDRLLYVGPPNESDREEIFRIHLRKIPCNPDVSIKEFAYQTEGFTGADISFVCGQAGHATLEESLNATEIRMQHLKTAIGQVKPLDIRPYKALSAKFHRLVISIGQEEKTEEKRKHPLFNWKCLIHKVSSCFTLTTPQLK
ncbi:LOW QUALITY PROTEIN: calmodulin-interacting protein 111-like [Ziziphus jujuba]|uniref:LOW QUALITY PROTEIN: calmodulin-interacting protein 111-like n=1 Tax=Ziziphus jujuba TaxID=326968 RepID=A0ABM4AFQ2_ZIZJJ|nr:LOW QUALITY PROTEIN: calmodulin-interacting protein 111-like [Ziziphus jujuba]